ncbi:MAG: acyl-CoA dehydrogenase [Thermodesulfobacteriota bacterium]
MAEKFFSERNLKFLLHEVHQAQDLTGFAYFAEHSRESFDLVLDTAARLARDVLKPAHREMDQKPPVFENGRVKVHPLVRPLMKECGAGGWIAAQSPFEAGGQQLPTMINAACAFIMNAANFSASVYPFLTAGAAELIESFGSEELKTTFIPKMHSGEWQGTMALTEPQAGSSLSDITTLAEPTDQGYYLLRGQKIFISAGDHDGVDNIVHLLLAKIKGAPPGVKGISLFVAPKLRPGPGGLEFNDLNVAGIYHKLGYRGCPLTQLSLGENNDCRGWLVGEAHRGLPYMFQMMNGARIGVGIQAAAIASAAYYDSLEYARTRLQGRRLTSKDPTTPQIPILEHADVKRMLLFQRAVVEGSLGLLLQVSRYADLAKAAEGEDQEKYALLLDLLTPVAKTYPSEMGILAVSQALQILGGYGYCDEFPVEQHFRDMRIHPIHEGTTGIQGLDLLGRKVVMKQGRALSLYLEELEKTAAAASADEVLAPYGRRLSEASGKLKEVTGRLIGLALEGQVDLFLADSTLYLEFFGIIALAWQWLLQGLALRQGLAGRPSEAEAGFYQGKLAAMKFFFHYELPKIQGLVGRLLESDGLVLSVDSGFLAD